MRIILSPAKKMLIDTDQMACTGLPVFPEKTREIMKWMQSLSYEEAKKLWACNDSIAEENYQRFQNMDLTRQLTPAILSYEGIAYQYMAPSVFENGEFSYVQEHLRILSAFYGVVKPLDGVVPYRLEMQAKAKIAATKDLYSYWGDALYGEVLDESRIIINLASKEYSKCIEKYLTPKDTYITCIFGELDSDKKTGKPKIVQKGVYAKMARGEMVRYMAMHTIEDPEDMKKFHSLGYAFSDALSDEKTFIFIKNAE